MKTGTPLYSFSLGADLVAASPSVFACGSGPISIAYGFDSIWIGCTNTGNVERYDLSGNKLASIHLSSPQGICVGAGSLWVTDLTLNTVSRIDPATNVVIATIAVGLRPTDCCFDGQFIWTSNFNGASISKVDPGKNAVVDWLRPVTTPSFRLCFDGERLWVGDWNGGQVVGIDVSTGAVKQVTGISEPWGMFFDGASIWVSSYASGVVYGINPDSGSIAFSGSLAPNAGPHDVIGVGKEIWVANSNLNTVQCLDRFTRAVIRTIPVGADPAGLCFDGSSVWVTNALGNSVMRFQVKEIW